MPVLPNILAAADRPSDNDNAVFPLPLSNAAFTFDSFGVAGFFGGDSSVAGMATTNLIPGRRWVGWFNTPGSYEIAKQYGPLGNGKLLDGLFPEGEHDPARLFKLDGREGPPFVAAHSGTVFQRTGHLGHLITSRAPDIRRSRKRFEGKHGRHTGGPSVTVVNLNHMANLPERSEPQLPKSLQAFWSIVPISVSVGASVLCALVADWFCFASIAVGIVAHGLACYVIGSGKLNFKHPKPAEHAPPGDGVLKGDRAWVVLVGAEGVVNVFTRGRFLLQYGTNDLQQGTNPEKASDQGRPLSTPSTLYNVTPPHQQYVPPPQPPMALPQPSTLSTTPTPSTPSASSTRSHIPPQWLIGPCALFLVAQFLVQLLLIPLGTLFGQIMFIATVVASWVYNTYLSSIDRDEIQKQILFKELQLTEGHIHKYELNTFTSTVAFTCFVLASANPLKDPAVFLDEMLPNQTDVWKVWKEKMGEKMKAGVDLTEVKFSKADCDAVEGEREKDLLKTLFDDAEDAWGAWSEVRDTVFPSNLKT